MPRSVWKGPFFSMKLMNAIRADVQREGVKTYERSSTIIPPMIGAKLLVHTGNSFTPVTIKEDMVGKKVGYYAKTKKPWKFRATNANKK